MIRFWSTFLIRMDVYWRETEFKTTNHLVGQIILSKKDYPIVFLKVTLRLFSKKKSDLKWQTVKLKWEVLCKAIFLFSLFLSLQVPSLYHGIIALLLHNTLKWSAISGLSFFEWCCWPRKSVLRGARAFKSANTLGLCQCKAMLPKY